VVKVMMIKRRVLFLIVDHGGEVGISLNDTHTDLPLFIHHDWGYTHVCLLWSLLNVCGSGKYNSSIMKMQKRDEKRSSSHNFLQMQI
jgi:hypothetical protein